MIYQPLQEEKYRIVLHGALFNCKYIHPVHTSSYTFRDNQSKAADRSVLAHLVGECLFIHLLTNAYICCLYDVHTMLHYTSTTSGHDAPVFISSDPVGPLYAYQREEILIRIPTTTYCCDSQVLM